MDTYNDFDIADYPPGNAMSLPDNPHGITQEEKLQFSKLLSGASEATIIVMVIIVGVCYIVNGEIPAGLVDFAKWVVGGTSATGVAYMIKSGIENKAKIEHPEPAASEQGIVFVDPEENDI